MDSERVAALRMMPRTAEVTVLEPGLRTPRIDIHRCSASTTTSPPPPAAYTQPNFTRTR